jgi:hypothetical protein
MTSSVAHKTLGSRINTSARVIEYTSALVKLVGLTVGQKMIIILSIRDVNVLIFWCRRFTSNNKLMHMSCKILFGKNKLYKEVLILSIYLYLSKLESNSSIIIIRPGQNSLPVFGFRVHLNREVLNIRIQTDYYLLQLL